MLFHKTGEAVSARLVGFSTTENSLDVQTVTPFSHLFAGQVGALVTNQLLWWSKDSDPCLHDRIGEMFGRLTVLQGASKLEPEEFIYE